MAKSNYQTTISIDVRHSAFHFYSMDGNDLSTITHSIKGFSGNLFDEAFFHRFKKAVSKYAATVPADGIRKVTVILPDTVVHNDTINLPTMRGKGQTQKNLDVTLRGLYRNYSDLIILPSMVAQNKQYTVYSLTAVQKHIISSLYAACAENKMFVDTVVSASAATIGGAVELDPKLARGSYVFLDIKDTYSRIIFVANGKKVGFYSLPFGHEFLSNPKITPEDMLFDHSYAALAVLNANEKAKSKKLTVLGTETSESSDETDFEDEAEKLPEAEPVVQEQENVKIFTKKGPRRLPKFMQREIPETPEGILYENFRVLVKWTLDLIARNQKLTAIDQPKFVCVNMPKELMGVLDTVNTEAEENGILFRPFITDDAVLSATSNLDLFGGLCKKNIHQDNKF